MRTIELIHDADCPNAGLARDRLRRALASLALPTTWKEWSRADPRCPPYTERYGSPTILVDGRDVAGVQPGDGFASCRLYADGNGAFSGAPTVATITTALTGNIRRGAGWRSSLAVIPGLGASLVPVGVCPACWPAYAGLLGSLGLGFLLETTYLLLLTAVLLGVALGSLAYRARSRRGYRPFGLGTLAAATALVGKFALSSNLVTYVGLGLLVAASVWNSWPRRVATVSRCGACTPQQ